MEMASYPEFPGGTREINYPEFSPGGGEGLGQGQMCSWDAYGD